MNTGRRDRLSRHQAHNLSAGDYLSLATDAPALNGQGAGSFYGLEVSGGPARAAVRARDFQAIETALGKILERQLV
jgi:hypothetical protein